MPKHPTNPNLKIELNKEKAEELIIKILEMRHTFPCFNHPHAYPDAIIPEGVEKGSLQHRLFLYYGCVTDSQRKSIDAYASVRSLNNAVSLETLQEIERKRLEELVDKHIGDNKKRNVTNALHRNSRTLQEKYQGDPRNMFKGFTAEPDIKEVKEAQEEIGELFLYGPGKSALLLKNFARFKIWDIPEPMIPVKIDLHAARISLGYPDLFEFYDGDEKIKYKDYKTGVQTIDVKKFNQRLQDLFLEITSEKGYSGIELDDAMWLIGSKFCYHNNLSFCSTNCLVGCNERPDSVDKNTYWFPGTEIRTGIGQGLLF